MGNASSIDASVVVYLDINGKQEKVRDFASLPLSKVRT